MGSALAPVTAGSIFTAWSLQPLAVAAAACYVAWYARGVLALRRRGEHWPVWRSALFGLGIVAFVWGTCGLPQTYNRSLYVDWVSQTLGLWLLVPVVLMSGQPMELAHRLRGEQSLAARFLRSRVGRVLANPLVGPAIVPVVSALLFFGPLPGWVTATPVAGWVLQLVLVGLGSLMVLPLVSSQDDRTSLAIGMAAAVGLFELLLDAVPGIVLRYSTHLSSDFFNHRLLHPWSLQPLYDQQWGGNVLWAVAEVLDLPFLLFVIWRWIAADAREAEQIDAVLDAERIARSSADDPAPVDAPWWLTDPRIKERFRES